jgi:hypothetical protein
MGVGSRLAMNVLRESEEVQDGDLVPAHEDTPADVDQILLVVVRWLGCDTQIGTAPTTSQSADVRAVRRRLIRYTRSFARSIDLG